MDRVKRNRSARGIKNGRSKLSEREVIEIYRDRITLKEVLARKYKIDSKIIRLIHKKEIWKHILKDL